MPISSTAVIPYILHEVLVKQPKTVLDVGIGNGFYGAAVKNYIKDCELIGIEAFHDYENLNWGHYKQVILKDVRHVEITHKYDTIICADVIEHFEKEEGKAVIEKLKQSLAPGGQLLISTPSIFCEQGAVGGNEFEKHLSLWSVNDFIELGFGILKDGTPDNFGHWMIVAKFTL